MTMVTKDRICLIAGLGNPGREYSETRHNIGFMVIDELLKVLPGSFDKNDKYNSIYWKGRFRGHTLLLQKPMTYMNLSGKAVAGLARNNDLTPAEVMLIYDDMDLPLGKLRIRKRGSSAGHNGVESVIECLNTSGFPRVRVGIGRKKRERHIDHVLSTFAEDEQSLLEKVIKASVDAVLLSLSRGVGEAMNRFNGMAIEAEEDQDDGKLPEKES